MRTATRRIGLGFAIVARTYWSPSRSPPARRGDRSLWPPAPGATTTEVFVVSHGYHAGIVVPRAALAAAASRQGLAALAARTRFAGFDRLEIGWGDEGFYREVPSAQSLTVALALRPRCSGRSNPTVLQVVGVSAVRATFPHSDLVRLDLGEAGFARLAEKLDASFARGAGGLPVDLGPGLYGTSLFFRASGAFHLFNVCNHWLSRPARCRRRLTAPICGNAALRPAARPRVALGSRTRLPARAPKP